MIFLQSEKVFTLLPRSESPCLSPWAFGSCEAPQTQAPCCPERILRPQG